MNGRLKNLDYAFNPSSIAFIGATESLNKWGFLILNNILTGGYEGEVYPVNPGRDTILGHKTYASVADIRGPIDLAVFAVPSGQVINAVAGCTGLGIKAGIVVTAGFKEQGDDGAELEAELLKKGREAGMILIGPNCQGIACPPSKLYCWMPILYHPPAGSISFVSQSGNVLNMLIGHVESCGLGAHKAVSSGNEADIKTEDYLSYFSEDPDTDVIVSYMEGVRDGRALLDRASAASRKKPVVMLKGGRTQSGVSAAKSHTGAMAVSEKLFEAAARQAGITMVRSIEEAGIIASSFINRPLPKGKRVGIVTGGGGLGVLAADFCTEQGLEVPQLSAPTLRELERLMPDWWVPGNPVDLVAGLDFNIIKPAIEILMKSGEVDSIMFLWIGAPKNEDPVDTSKGGLDISKVWDIIRDRFVAYTTELYALMQELQVPLYISTSVDLDETDSNGSLLKGQPAIYPSVESACNAISAMSAYSQFRGITD
jgi:acyl-CoA synthetase (NDP forming)